MPIQWLVCHSLRGRVAHRPQCIRLVSIRIIKKYIQIPDTFVILIFLKSGEWNQFLKREESFRQIDLQKVYRRYFS